MTTKKLSSQVFQLDPLVDPRWPAFAAYDPRASVFHSAAWLSVLRKAYGYDTIVYTSSPPGAPLIDGLLFCRVKSWLTGRRLVSLPFSDHCEPLVDGVDALNKLLIPALQELREGKIKYIDVRPLSLSFSEGT